MTRAAIEGFRLSPQQQTLWHLQQSGAADVYTARGAIAVDGECDLVALEAALRCLVERHEVLRTDFQQVAGLDLPLQVVSDRADLALTHSDISHLAEDEQAAEVSAWIQSLNRHAREGQTARLEFKLVRLAPAKRLLLIELPGLCADHLTIRNLALALSREYAAQIGGKDADYEPVQYADFSEWQSGLLESEETAAERQYWLKLDLADTSSTELPFAVKPAAASAFAPRWVDSPVDPALLSKIDALASQAKTTGHGYLLACWQILLWRLSGKPELIVGVRYDGRSYDGLDEALGLLARYLPARVCPDADMPFSRFLLQVEQQRAEMGDHQEYFSRALSVDAQTKGPDFFDYCFEFDGRQAACEVAGVNFSVCQQRVCMDRFKLKLACADDHDGLLTRFHFDANLFRYEDIARIAEAFHALLYSAATCPEQTIDGLEIMGQEEKRQLLYDFSGSGQNPSAPQPLHELFEAQAARTPGMVAVVFDQSKLTYAQLNTRANQLAWRLRRAGVRPETLVGLYLNRSAEAIIGLLGILKAGGAYVPVEAESPLERLRFVINDTRMPVVLTERLLLSNLAESGAETICLDDPELGLGRESSDKPPSRVTESNLAYLIYTSGSTGQPKAVAVEHRQITGYVQAVVERLALPAPANYALVSTMAADLGHTMLFPSLCTGGTLHVISKERASDAIALADYFTLHKIDCLKIVPSHLSALLSASRPKEILPRQRLVLGGEAATWELVEKLDGLGGSCAIYNHYGPTETTVGVLTSAATASATIYHARTVPLGRALTGAQVYIVDAQGRPASIGVAGELQIGGAAVSRGYYNRPEMTATRFMPDPFSDQPGSRLYCTGDRARFLPDGNLEFLGRIDQQVKIRGYRVEPGEVQAALSRHAGVAQCAVIAREDRPGEKRLVAYLVARQGETVTAGDLRAFLTGMLPEYMIPAGFVTLNALPLTANGKLDTRALPVPDAVTTASGDEYVAPRTSQEKALADIWSKLLGVETVGVHDNFFALGGDSIRSIQVRALAHEQGITVSLQQLFQHPTIHELAVQLGEQRPEVGAIAATTAFSLISEADRERLPEGIEDAYPLARLQAGMLFHSELSPGSAMYHDITSLHLKCPCDLPSMQRTLDRLARRHPVLRTSFDLAGYSEPLQLVHESVDLRLAVEDLSHLPEAEQERAIDAWLEADTKRKFDWQQPGLWRVQIHQRTPETFQFSLSRHHVILDGWSSASLLSEMFGLYLGLLRGESIEAAAPPLSSYRDFVALERETLESDASRDYWRERLDDCAATTLPGLTPARAGEPARKVTAQEVPVSASISDGVKAFARRARVPLKSVLLAAHLRVLSLASGADDLVTGLVTHGRPEQADAEQVLGLFLNTVPFRQRLDGGTWFDLARDTFDNEQAMFAHRRYPLAEIQRLGGGQPLFETAFIFVHFHVYQSLLPVAGEIHPLGVKNVQETNFKFVAEFSQDPFSSQVRLTFYADAAQLSDEQLELLAGYYEAALAAIAEAPGERYEHFSLLSAAERRLLLSEWNGSREDLQACLIHEMFEAQAARLPEDIAVSFGEQEVTYRELNRRANQLARYLQRFGVGPEILVGLYLDRSLDMLVGLLAILKAGGAYVPLSPAYPKERIGYILEDAKVEVIVTHSELIASLPDNCSLIAVDKDCVRIESESAENSSPRQSTENLAYVIYTSGSTGRPKGVQIPHRAVYNFLDSMRQSPGLTAADRLLAVTTISFDIAALEMFLPLTVGARVVIATTDEAADGERLVKKLKAGPITMMQATPATWRLLIDMGWQGGDGLKILCGGEALPRELANQLLDRCDHFWNMYGPTETTIWSTLQRIDAKEGPICIGRPIANTEIYILDSHGEAVPVGVAGRLHIGGEGLARGYYGRPELTAERFRPNPQGSGERLYDSGDLARWMADGRVEYLGRSDQQVKVRGYRIELGEIEQAVREQAGVKAAAVALREAAGEKELVGYVVWEEGAAASEAELRRGLKAKLPEYMVPRRYVELAGLPLTPNGKLDRKALPAPGGERPSIGKNYVAPRTAAEQVAAGIIAQALGLNEVGVTDNLFELGANSLIATRVIARLRSAFRIEMPLRDLFDAPTVEGVVNIAARLWDSRETVEGIAQLSLEIDALSADDVEKMFVEANQSI